VLTKSANTAVIVGKHNNRSLANGRIEDFLGRSIKAIGID